MAGSLEDFIAELQALSQKLEDLDTELLASRETAEQAADLASVTFSMAQMQSVIGMAILNDIRAEDQSIMADIDDSLRRIQQIQDAIQRMIQRLQGD